MAADLGELLGSFQRSAFRLETLDRYRVPEQEPWLEVWRRHKVIPISDENYPWLKVVSDATAVGRSFQRVHVVGQPLSEYVRWELEMYRLLEEAGEDIRIADRDLYPELYDLGPDFWLFDDSIAVVMHYDPAGWYLGAQVARDAAPYRAQRDLALRRSAYLSTFLAAVGGAR